MNKLSPYIQEMNGELWLVETDRDNLLVSYKIKEVLYEEVSPFQHIMIVDSYDFGRMLVLDGAVQTTYHDGFIYNEMISHIPLTLHTHPQRVLIVGGGDCGVVNEVCKYTTVNLIEMVEIDEAVVAASKKYLPEIAGTATDPRVQFIFDDGVEYVKAKSECYDVIIIDSSDPVGPAVQLFELDFYRNLFHALKPEGLMVCQSQSPIFQQHIMRQSYEHIGSLFPDTQLYTAVVPSYPGGLWSFTLGSKTSAQLKEIYFKKKTRYVNEDIIKSCFMLPQFIKVALE